MSVKLKRIISITVMVLAVLMLAVCLVACDDDNDPNDKPLTFAEGTTIDDVIRMLEDGTITSCTQKFYSKESGEYVLFNKAEINNNNLAVSYMFDIDGNEMEAYRMYTIFSPEEGKEYYIGNLQASSDGVGYYWRNSDNKPINEIKDLLSGDEIDVNNIVIDQNTITYTYGFAKIVISDINSTTVQLPDKYSNYKELAVEMPNNI